MNAPSKETTIKVGIPLILFLGAIVSATLFADDRYAKNTDVKELARTVKQDVRSTADYLRKQMLEDKLFELDLILDERKTDVQRAMANRVKTQLQDVQGRINSSER